MSQQSMWTAVQTHYLVSTRQDIRVNNFLADSPSLLQTYKDQTQKLIILMKDFGKWTSQFKYLQAYSFITGVRCKDRAVDL